MSDTHAISLKRSTALLAAVAFMAALTAVNVASIFGSKVGAADLTARSLTLSSTVSGDESGDSVAGSPTNGSAAEHTFSFQADASSAASATFQYCTTALGACVAPTGLVLSSANVVSGGGSVTASSNTLTWVNTITNGVATEVTFGNITNPTYVDSPSDPDTNTFFVRIATHNNATPAPPTTVVDEGTVASAITRGIEISARVAETLGFSTTGDFAGVTAPTDSCEPVTGLGQITLGDVNEGTLSLTQAYDNYSAFRLYTNASGGVEVQYHGNTLTRSTGTGDIDQIGPTAADSDPGTEQFGLAIDTSVGGNNAVSTASRSGTLDMTHVTTSAGLALGGPLTPAAAYADGDGTLTTGGAQFAFESNTPTTIASSDPGQGGFVECKTAAVRYIANISPTTTSGTYTTTIVYSAVPTY